MDVNELYQEHLKDQKNNEVKFENHEQEIKSLKHRVDDLENDTKILERLSYSVETMCKELQEQGKRIEHIENKPAARWDKLTDTIIACAVTGIVGYAIGVIF